MSEETACDDAWSCDALPTPHVVAVTSRPSMLNEPTATDSDGVRVGIVAGLTSKFGAKRNSPRPWSRSKASSSRADDRLHVAAPVPIRVNVPSLPSQRGNVEPPATAPFFGVHADTESSRRPSRIARAPLVLTLWELCESDTHCNELRARLQNTDATAADPSSQRTYLHAAAASGARAVVIVLLQAGCDPQAVCTRGRTALDEAVDAGHWGIVKLLLWLYSDTKSMSPTFPAGPGSGASLRPADSRPLGVELPSCGEGCWAPVCPDSSCDRPRHPTLSRSAAQQDLTLSRRIGQQPHATPPLHRDSVLLQEEDTMLSSCSLS